MDLTAFSSDRLTRICAGLAAGTFLALIHGMITITSKADQIITGIALNLFSLGITKLCCQLIFQSSSNSARIGGIEAWNTGAVHPVMTLLTNPIILFTLGIAIASHPVLFHTKYGLRLRSVGEHPGAADSLGISVSRLRYSGILVSGALSGIGGAWLALDQHSFTDGMSAGRGFIALAAVIVGKWKPLGATMACLIFAAAETVVIHLQGSVIPFQFIQMIPYVITMIILAGFIGKATPPAADGTPYNTEQD